MLELVIVSHRILKIPHVLQIDLFMYQKAHFQFSIYSFSYSFTIFMSCIYIYITSAQRFYIGSRLIVKISRIYGRAYCFSQCKVKSHIN